MQKKNVSQILGTLPPYLANIFTKKSYKRYVIINISSCSTIEQTLLINIVCINLEYIGKYILKLLLIVFCFFVFLNHTKLMLEKSKEQLKVAIAQREKFGKELMGTGDRAGTGDLYKMLNTLNELIEKWDENTELYGT